MPKLFLRSSKLAPWAPMPGAKISDCGRRGRTFAASFTVAPTTARTAPISRPRAASKAVILPAKASVTERPSASRASHRAAVGICGAHNTNAAALHWAARSRRGRRAVEREVGDDRHGVAAETAARAQPDLGVSLHGSTTSPRLQWMMLSALFANHHHHSRHRPPRWTEAARRCRPGSSTPKQERHSRITLLPL